MDQRPGAVANGIDRNGSAEDKEREGSASSTSALALQTVTPNAIGSDAATADEDKEMKIAIEKTLAEFAQERSHLRSASGAETLSNLTMRQPPASALSSHPQAEDGGVKPAISRRRDSTEEEADERADMQELMSLVEKVKRQIPA